MSLSIANIKALLAAEYPQATQDVHNFMSWIEGKEAEIKAAETEFQGLITRQQMLGQTLVRAGYTVSAGTIAAPAAA
jgi:hypothetical protein